MEIIVEMSGMKLTDNTADRLVTYSLGTCLGLTIFDPVARVGGMIHCQLPFSGIDPHKAIENPCMFVDTGIPYLFEESYKLGVKKNRAIIKIAGCNTSRKGEFFSIGERNYVTMKRLLWKNNIFVSAEDVGGEIARTISLDCATGLLSVRKNGSVKEL